MFETNKAPGRKISRNPLIAVATALTGKITDPRQHTLQELF
ncbi:MAG: hypothetical protein QXN23_03645 [Candidatus Caldarchaeum sp.]|nr:hypothetical protein [Candidatus Caldarchaeales archaeon]MDJ0272188.1 hypothetical protein [Candidatus Caldarchaeales archaeon]